MHAFPSGANARQRRTVLAKDAQKIQFVPNSVSGTPEKPMEVPRTPEYKTQGKSLHMHKNTFKPEK